jgi:hypothetical protein
VETQIKLAVIRLLGHTSPQVEALDQLILMYPMRVTEPPVVEDLESDK